MAYNALVKIQMKRASSSDWNRTTDTGSAWSGYLLREAEIGVEVFTDNSVKLKVGNGINVWKDLPYVDANTAKYVTVLPPISKAEPGIFYIYKGTIYYTLDNANWNKIGGVFKFDDLEGRPKYNGTTITSKTNIPKSITAASELKYVNTSSGLSSTNVQSAIDELNQNIDSKLDKSSSANTIYGVDNSGNQTQTSYSTSKTGNTIVKRTATGTIKASNPVDNDDVVTKQYFTTETNKIKTDVTANKNNITSLRTQVDKNVTNITNLQNQLTNVKNNVATNATNINTNKIDISNIKTQLATISAGNTDTTNDINTLKTKVNNNTNNITNLRTDLTTEETTRYNNDVKTLGMTGVSNNIITLTKNDGSTLTAQIPIASNTVNGLITKEAYKQIQDNASEINSLKEKGGHFIGQSFATKAQLDSFTIDNDIKVGDFTFVVDDETHKGATTKYFCINQGGAKVFSFGYVIEYDPIGIGNTSTAGIVKSSTTNGKVFIENDGTMSLNGYDSILSDLNDKVDKVSGKGLSTNDYITADKNKVNLIITGGDGTTFLADDGTYKTISIPEDNDGITDVTSGGTSVVNALKVAELHKVASSGNYNDLINIPTNLVKDSSYVHTDNNLTNALKQKIEILATTGDGNSFLGDDGAYHELKAIAKTGSYNDLVDVPQNLVEDANYVHTDNNFTNTLKKKLEDLNANGEENVLEAVSLNGTALAIDSNKSVNIDLSDYALEDNVPTKISQLTNDVNMVKDASYVHTDNNFTTALKTKLDGITAKAEPNKINTIKVNNTALVPDSNKAVNIDLTKYVLTKDYEEQVNSIKDDIQSLVNGGLWRGIFTTKAALPTKTPNTKFVGGKVDVNDFIIIKQDETHLDGMGKPYKTRYYATAIDATGNITWTFFDEEKGSIAIASNTSLGLVKGKEYNASDETTIGTVAVNSTTGEMSVNGLDALGYIPLTGTERNNSSTINPNSNAKPVTGPIWFENNKGGIYGTMGDSDCWGIRGRDGSSSDNGYLEIATGDNGNDPIYVRQYNNANSSTSSNLSCIDGFPNSVSDGKCVITRTLALLDTNGNTQLPGNLLMTKSGANITWNEGVTRQRIATNDTSSTTDSAFILQESSNSGSTYKDLLTINGNGNTLATGFIEADKQHTNGYKVRIGGSNGTNNGDFSYIDNRKNSDDTLLGNILIHSDGVVNVDHGKKLALGRKAKSSYYAVMQWNNDEECVEFVFD